MHAPLLAAILTLAPANGLTTHTWITLRAVDLLPEGELATLLRKPELRDYLVSGTIFPDGGYAVSDGYGELAHWEPFQIGFLERIRTDFPAPFSPEAEKHIAFYFGLASHGMADQIFDSLYMQRAHEYDRESDWAMKSMDEATDVVWASLHGAQVVPPRWVPTEMFIDLFNRTGAHTVDAETMLRGQNLAGFAVAVVGMLAADRQAVADYKEQFPWATSHLDDERVPGRPEMEAEIIAEYWQRQWARLRGTIEGESLVLRTIPSDGSKGLGRAVMSVESRISIAFARRFRSADVTAQAFRIEDSSGRAIDFEPWLFYGDNSHVVHLVPGVELAADEVYTVTVNAGLTFAEGVSTSAPHVFHASTEIAGAGEASSCACVRVQAPRASPPMVVVLLLLVFGLLAGRPEKPRAPIVPRRFQI